MRVSIWSTSNIRHVWSGLDSPWHNSSSRRESASGFLKFCQPSLGASTFYLVKEKKKKKKRGRTLWRLQSLEEKGSSILKLVRCVKLCPSAFIPRYISVFLNLSFAPGELSSRLSANRFHPSVHLPSPRCVDKTAREAGNSRVPETVVSGCWISGHVTAGKLSTNRRWCVIYGWPGVSFG